MAQAEKLFNEYCTKVGGGGDEKPEDRKAEGKAATQTLNEYEIKRDILPDLVIKMGWEPQDDMLETSLGMVPKSNAGPGKLNWTDFLLFMKSYRGLEVDLFNARAGLAKEEVENYRETFDEYDKSGDGELSLKELVPVLTALGHEPRTVIQRQKLTAILAEVDEDGSGEIGFDEFLQLMRKFIDQSMAEQMLKERDIVAKTRFDTDEVAQWREIFLKFDTDGSSSFDKDEGKVLLLAVGINLNERTMHDRYLQLFVEVDLDRDDAMDFPEFLLMMRRLLDLDFGGIATRMGIKDHDNDEKSVAEKKKEERSERRKSKAPGK
jgi:Ca2+-binding EF-hand superfamily protein